MLLRNTRLFLAFFILASFIACSDKTSGSLPGSKPDLSIPASVFDPASSTNCGNGVCDSATEDATSCPLDCSISGATLTTPTPAAPGTPSCGNGICETDESHVSCALDCVDTSAAFPFEVASLNPSSVMVTAGTNGHLRLTLRRGSENGNVRVSINNVSPTISGIGMMPNPALIPAGISFVEFDITTEVSANPDTYNVEFKVENEAGTAARYVGMILKVIPAGTTPGGTPPGGTPASPSFEIISAPRGGVINAGSNERVDVTIARHGDEGEARITLQSVTPLHSGITVFPEAIRSGSNEGTVGLSVDAAVPQAIYYLTFRVYTERTIRNFSYELKVDPPVASGGAGTGLCNNDGVCGATETSLDCLADCPRSIPCNNDLWCDDSETVDSCAHDCRATASCNFDNTCNASTETLETCPHDCAVSFSARTEPSGRGNVTVGNSLALRFHITRRGDEGAIRVQLDSVLPGPTSGTITALPVTIPAGSNEGVLNVTASADVPAGFDHVLIFGVRSPSHSDTVSFTLSTLAVSSTPTPSPYILTDPSIIADGSRLHETPALVGEPCTQDNRSVWVKTTGNDVNPGTITDPLASLLVAREMAARSNPPKDVCVMMGEYTLSRGGYSNYSLVPNSAGIPVNFYGGYMWSTSSNRIIRPDFMARPSTIRNNGSVPVVIYAPSNSNDHPVMEGFMIMQDGNVAAPGVPAMRIEGSAPIIRGNTIAVSSTNTARTAAGQNNFKRTALQIVSAPSSNTVGMLIESNNIRVDDVISARFGSTVAVHVSNELSRGNITGVTLRNNRINAGRAAKASIGVLQSGRDDTLTNLTIEGNEIVFDGAIQEKAVAASDIGSLDYWLSSSVSGTGVPDELNGGQSGGIIMGMRLSDSPTEAVLLPYGPAAAKILRNKIHPRTDISPFYTGYASYGILLNRSANALLGSNFVQPGFAGNFSSALYLMSSSGKFLNNSFVSSSVSIDRFVRSGTIQTGTRGGPDYQEIVFNDFLGVNPALYLANGNSALEFVNNIFSNSSTGTPQKPSVGIFTNTNYRAISRLSHNLFDRNLSALMATYPEHNDRLSLIPQDAVSTLARSAGLSITPETNFVEAPGFVNARVFDLHLENIPGGSAAHNQGLCDASLFRLNPQDIDGLNWPMTNCDIGADEFVSP